jgi:nucleotide-binding universal stress UspA family protein
MTKLLAAIDNNSAARPVLAAALAFEDLFDAEVEAIHAAEDGARTARAAAAAAGVPLRLTSRPVVRSIAAAAADPDVAAVVLGARAAHGGATPAGHVALQLAVALSKPLLVVPPEAVVPARLRRILVPLNGSRTSAAALTETIELANRHDLTVIVLHVHHLAALPLFTEQPQHELEAWADEFLHRHLVDHEDAELELRSGSPGRHVLEVAAARRADLIALGWAQDLAEGHAAVVREVLERSPVPVLLVGVGAAPASAVATAQGSLHEL